MCFKRNQIWVYQDQHFSPGGGGATPQEMLAMSANIFTSHHLKWGCGGASMGRGQGTIKHPMMCKTNTRQRIAWPKMSTVPRLRSHEIR